MRKLQTQPRIPIVFQQQKISTKTKLAKLLKQYNACMTYNPDQNTYEVDVEVKFNSVGEKMHFMQNYLKKPRQDSILEEQEHNNSKKYLTQLKEQKALIDFSSIKKNQELSYSISQQEHHLKMYEPKPGAFIDSVIEEDKNYLNLEQLKLRIEESIDKSCQQILLMKVRPDVAKHQRQSKNQKNKNITHGNFNLSTPIKQASMQIPDYRLSFSGKSKQQIMEEVNKDLIASNRQYQQQLVAGGLVMQENMLYQWSDEENSSDKVGANKDSSMSHPSYSTSKNHASNKMLSSAKKSNYQSLREQMKRSVKQFDSKQIKIEEDKKIGSNAPQTNKIMTKEQYDKMMADKQSPQIKQKPNAAKQSKLFQLPQKQQHKSITSSAASHKSNKSNQFSKPVRPNKIQHQQFKNFLLSHREKLDKIVQSYHKDPKQILIEDEFMFDSMNTSKDFSTKIIDEYKQRIEVNNQNMSSTEMVGYFKFLIRHAKSLYLDFQKGKRQQKM